MKRQIIRIDEAKCDGCGQCATACAEGAIRIINGKAKLVSESHCDGLGACLGECPQGAITIEQREAAPFDPDAVKALQAQGHTHAEHGRSCPGSMVRQMQPKAAETAKPTDQPSMLANWPVQLKLAPITAPYFHEARLLVAADCVACAAPDFHRRFLAGKVLLVGCPKLDDAAAYQKKLAAILSQNRIVSVEVAFMEVPCCFGMVHVVRSAIESSGKNIPLELVKLGIDGQVRSRERCDSGSAGAVV